MFIRKVKDRQHIVYILSSIRKFHRIKDFTTHLRTVPVPMLCFITKGSGVLSINDTLHRIEPFQLFYLAAGLSIEATVHSSEFEYYVIILDQISVTKRMRQWTINEASMPLRLGLAPGLLPIRETRQVLERIQQLYESNPFNCSKQTHPSKESRQKHTTTLHQDPDLQLQELIGFILRDLSEQQSQPSGDSGIDQSLAYMHKHFHEKISRETLARIAQLTPNAFCRSFKKTTGVSSTDYLNGIRIQHAKEQLAPGSSVKEVAGAVGYGSEYYFSRVFKETVGLSPTLFIKRERLKVATASRVSFQDNLSSIGMEAVASVDCYKYPGMDEAEYDRRIISAREQLRLVKPDLIIADFFHSSHYDLLKELAPTVIVKHHLDWRVTHMKIAELVGREKEAVQTFNQLDERTLEARKLLSLSITNDSVTILQVMHKLIRIQGAVNHPLNDLIYSGLGLKPGHAVPRNKMREEWPLEELPLPESDHLFVIKHSSHPEVEQLLNQLQHSPSWDSIHAVVHKQLHFAQNWLVLSWTPQGRNRIIDEILDVMVR
jgi:AraC-like DNA-binding protein